MNGDSALEDRLRATYRAVATSTTYSSPPPIGVMDSRPPRRHGPRQSLRVAAAFALVLAIAVAVAVVNVFDDDTRVRRVVPPSARPLFPEVEQHTGLDLFVRPRRVPPGYQLLYASRPTAEQGGGGSDGSPTVWQHWVRLDRTGTRPIAGFSLGWGPSDVSEAPSSPLLPPEERDALDDYRGGPPIALSGHDAYWSSHLQALAWDQDGELVVVKSWVDTPDSDWPINLTQADLEAIGRDVVRDPDGSFRLAKQPPGYRLAAQVPTVVTSGVNPRKIVYTDGNNQGFAIELIDDTEAPPGLALMNANARLVDIGTSTGVLTEGHDWSSHRLNCQALDAFLCSINLGDRTFTYLQWLAPDSTGVTITAVGLTDQQVIDLARSLEPITASEWTRFRDQGATPGCVAIAHCVGFDHGPRNG